jgi:small basic protein (TIGR04137 family)
MSMHASLKTARALERHRNVLTRAERIAYLEDHEKSHRKVAVGGKAKKKAKQGEEGGEEKKI